MSVKNNLKLYCVYHDKELETHYNHTKYWFKPYYKPLVENEWFKLYYTKEGHENSLDAVQDYFCEFTAMYWIYKNNLYSPYIGLCHYGRQRLRAVMEQQDFKDIEILGKFEDWGSLKSGTKESGPIMERYNNYLLEEFFDFIKTNYDKDSRIYRYFITNYDKPVKILPNINFITKWEYFYEITKCLSDFFDYDDKINNLNWEHDNYTKYITDKWINKKDFAPCYLPHSQEWYLVSPDSNRYRIYSYIIEVFVGYYFGNLKAELNGE